MCVFVCVCVGGDEIRGRTRFGGGGEKRGLERGDREKEQGDGGGGGKRVGRDVYVIVH